MPSFKSFEEIEAWKMARELAFDLAKLCEREPFRRDFSLKDQMRRSIGSAMDNIAEGFERNGNREFIQFLFIAKGSCGEFRSQLFRALDLNYISTEEAEALTAKAKRVSSAISGLIKYLLNSTYKGYKFQ